MSGLREFQATEATRIASGDTGAKLGVGWLGVAATQDIAKSVREPAACDRERCCRINFEPYRRSRRKEKRLFTPCARSEDQPVGPDGSASRSFSCRSRRFVLSVSIDPRSLKCRAFDGSAHRRLRFSSYPLRHLLLANSREQLLSFYLRPSAAALPPTLRALSFAHAAIDERDARGGSGGATRA